MRAALTAVVVCGVLSQACEKVTSAPASPEAGVVAGWTVLDAGTQNLNAVSGISTTAIWAVGDVGTILHWDGSSLQPEKSGTKANLRGVWAVDSTHVYAVGDAGTILARQGTTWKQVAVGLTREVLTGVWADAQRVVAVGSYGTVVLGATATSTYKLVANPDAENLLAVAATGAGPAVGVGALGIELSLSGASLSRGSIPSSAKLLTGIASTAGLTYIVGEQGLVLRGDSAGINPVPGFPSTTLRAVSIVGTDAWMVGLDGTICKVSGGVTSCYPYDDLRWFNGVYAASPTSIWIVGAGGTFLHGLPSKAATPVSPSDGGSVRLDGGKG